MLAKKKDGRLQLCVEYWALKTETLKNQYSLQLILVMPDRSCGAEMFTKPDLGNTYHLIQIMEDYEYIIELCTQYWQLQYGVMLLGVRNAPATFAAYIDNLLQSYINDFAGYIQADIPIYSTNQEEHEEQVRNVLERLQDQISYTYAE